MPSLADRSSAAPVKLMLIGNSGAGKTGAIASLVFAGYRVRILDMDVGLDALVNIIKAKDKSLLSRVSYMSFRDQYVGSSTGPKIKGAARAYVNAVQAMDKWEDGSVPARWGLDTVFVLDSLTHFGRSAFAWVKQMNPNLREPRQWYFEAQNAVEDNIALLTSEHFQTHVVMISHIDYREQADKSTKGFVSAVGKALGPKLPSYVNTLVLSETRGSGRSTKRMLKTFPTGEIDVKTPALNIEAEYPIETGLADLFRVLGAKPPK